jgi:hypothetical protein
LRFLQHMHDKKYNVGPLSSHSLAARSGRCWLSKLARQQASDGGRRQRQQAYITQAPEQQCVARQHQREGCEHSSYGQDLDFSPCPWCLSSHGTRCVLVRCATTVCGASKSQIRVASDWLKLRGGAPTSSYMLHTP